MGVAVAQLDDVGDDAARFATFDRAYRRRVAGLLRRYVPCEERVADLCQEAMIRAHRKGLHLDASADPWPWLARVARNLATDDARRQGPDHTPFDAARDSPATPELHAEYLARRRREAIRDALAGLPADAQRVLVARHFEDLSYDAIGAAHGMSTAAVRSALFRARRSFADRYHALAAERGLHVLVPATAWGAVTRRVRALQARLGQTIETLAGPAAQAAGLLQQAMAVAVLAGTAIVAPLLISPDPRVAPAAPAVLGSTTEVASAPPVTLDHPRTEPRLVQLAQHGGPGSNVPAGDPAAGEAAGGDDPGVVVGAPTIPAPPAPPSRVNVDTDDAGPAAPPGRAQAGVSLPIDDTALRDEHDVSVPTPPGVVEGDELRATGTSYVGADCKPQYREGSGMWAICTVLTAP